MPDEQTNTESQPTGIKPMTDDELVSFCSKELAKCIGGRLSGADSDADITQPLDYYLGRKPALTKARARDPNASRYVSQDVMDGIESTVGEIMPAFTTDEIAFYEPIDEEDEDTSRAESDIVNYLFMEEYDGFTVLQTALKDCFLHRNCSGKAYWDERKEVEYETFENVPELALPELLTPDDENQEIEVVEQEQLDTRNEEAAMAAGVMETAPAGQATPQDKVILEKLKESAQIHYNIKIKRTTKVGRPVIQNVPPEQVRVKSGHNSVYVSTCGFVAHDSLETESSLIAQGYDPILVGRIKDYTQDIDDESRSRDSEERDYSASHRSTRTVRVYECYAEIDFDGDGIAERRKIVIGDDSVLLENEPFNGVSIIGGATAIMPHKYKAISMFERLKDIQDAKTPVMRSVIDGVQLSSNPRIGVITGKANIDDILSSRTGGVVRMDRPDAAFEMPNPQVPQSSYMFLEHMDGVRRDRGGGAVDQTPETIGVAGDTAHGTERVLSKMELGNALSARNLGETFVRGIFIEMHNILRMHWPKGEKISAKINGKWVSTVPSEWRKRTSVTIQVGASLAERAKQSAVLSSVIDLQNQYLETGNIMYDEDKHYAAIADRIKLSGIRHPERYFLDPSAPEGEKKKRLVNAMKKRMKEREEHVQGLLVEAQAQLGQAEMMKAKAQNDANVIKFQNEQLKATIDRLKAEIDAMGKAGELKFKYAELLENSALKLTELEQLYQKNLNAEREANRGAGDEANGD
jgi:hypothetical protein